MVTPSNERTVLTGLDIIELKENNNGSTKASQARARKAAGEIKKLITPYKKANMEEVR